MMHKNQKSSKACRHLKIKTRWFAVKRFYKNENGSATVIVAILMVVLVGFSALVIDYGNMASQKRQLQNAVDAACLAAAASLPANTQSAQAAALEYLEANAPGAVLESLKFNNGNKKVTVTASLYVPYKFARAVVPDSGRTITTKATAIVTKCAWAKRLCTFFSQRDRSFAVYRPKLHIG